MGVRVLRTMLFVPGNNMRMIHKAGTLDADAIILDLEDAVPLAEKETARIFVKDSLEIAGSGCSDIFVRVNSSLSGLMEEDLKSIVYEGVSGIMLPKSEYKTDVLETEKMVAKLEEERGPEVGGIILIPLLETARGILNVSEIASSSKRVVAVGFGAVDYTRDMGIPLTKEGIELFHARSMIALASRAASIQAIDTPWIDIQDKEGLIKDSKLARQLGFRGKMLIHPSQIQPVNEIFSPSEQEVQYARMVVQAFQEAEAKGLGVVSLEGKMIDTANYLQAKELLSFAHAIAEKEEARRERNPQS